MSKQKIYTYRVTHPDYKTATVTATDSDSAILAAAKEWGLGRDWPTIIDDAVPLRIGEAKG